MPDVVVGLGDKHVAVPMADLKRGKDNRLVLGVTKDALGKMASDTMLYKNLNATLTSLTALLTDLRERPGRYINVKVF